jgi:hypothetical protein
MWIESDVRSVSSERADGETGLPLEPERLARGENVLIAGPAMTGKRRLLFSLLAENEDRTAVLISTKRGADRFRREFAADVPDGDAWETRIVDCVSKRRSVRNVRDTEEISYVSSPGDLTGIGIAASGFMREFYHAGDEVSVGLHSLSTLLMYSDLQRVFRFSHVMTGRVETADSVGVFTLDTTTHNTEAVDVLQGLFDVFVQVRDSPESPELRVRGSDLGPRGWTPF